jgi:hypothetical protein
MSNYAQTPSNHKGNLVITGPPKSYSFSFVPRAADCKEGLIMTTSVTFAHRRNPDKSIDSICTTCFRTIASEDTDDKLTAHEKRHLCDPYWQFSRAF